MFEEAIAIRRLKEQGGDEHPSPSRGTLAGETRAFCRQHTALRNNVRFRSTRFRTGDADAAVSPGTTAHGDLVTWVAAHLRERGVAVAPAVLEDWGSLLPINHAGAALHLVCGAIDGEPNRWLVAVEGRTGGFLDRLLRRTPPEIVRNAQQEVIILLHEALQREPTVSDIEWFRVGARQEELDHAATPD